MSTVQLPGSKIFDSLMQMHTGNQKYVVSLAKEFQHYLTKEHCQKGIIDQGKLKTMERKWTDIQYHVQYNADVEHQDVRMYCNKNQFSAVSFCGPNSKPHGARELSKHYHFRFDPKLGNCICAILRIPCPCVACTSMLYKPWIYGIPLDEQECYKPVTKCTYWPVLGSFNDWNIIQFSQK